MRLILATRNPSKVIQIKPLFANLPITIQSLAEAGISGEAVEDGATLEENALKKALYAHARSGAWSTADDTGFFIDALAGEPGIRAARWAGEEATTEDTMHFTLEKLRDVPEEKRTATFRTVAALVSPRGEMTAFIGEVAGRILLAPRVLCQPNMPYSAIFVPEGQEKVWAEMTTEEENAVSHRGKAFRRLREYLETQL